VNEWPLPLPPLAVLLLKDPPMELLLMWSDARGSEKHGAF
jgi:hypothetical protein